MPLLEPVQLAAGSQMVGLKALTAVKTAAVVHSRWCPSQSSMLSSGASGCRDELPRQLAALGQRLGALQGSLQALQDVMGLDGVLLYQRASRQVLQVQLPLSAWAVLPGSEDQLCLPSACVCKAAAGPTEPTLFE